MDSTDGLARGLDVIGQRSPDLVCPWQGLKLGPALNVSATRCIRRTTRDQTSDGDQPDPPAFQEPLYRGRSSRTGIKVIDPDRPRTSRAQDRAFRRRRGSARRSRGHDHGAHPHTSPRSTRPLGVRRVGRAHDVRATTLYIEMTESGRVLDTDRARLRPDERGRRAPVCARSRSRVSDGGEVSRGGPGRLFFIDNIFRFVQAGLRGFGAP